MALGLTTPVSLRNAFTRLYSTFDEARQGGTQTQALLDSLVLRVPSTDRYNTYGWLAGFPRFREWVGQRMVRGLTSRAYQIYNKDYEDTIGFDRDTFDDQKLVDANIGVQLLAEAARQLPFDLVLDLLRNGHTRVGYDGQNFFDTDHPISLDDEIGGTQSNYRTGFPLTRANYLTARTALRSFMGEDRRVFPNAGTLLLIVPTELEDAANAIVVADNGSPGGNTLRGTATVMAWPELSIDPTTWYLVNPNGTLKPFILQERQAPRFVSKTNPNDENVFWHKEYLFGADARYGAGYGAWWKIIKAVA
jgi:phage major head subunit gpT-like protein